MTGAVELLADLRARGVEVLAAGGNLRIRPASRVPPDLVEEVRRYKSELLAELAPPTGDPATWTLGELNRSSAPLVVWSKVLSDEVLFAPDGWLVPESETRPVLRVADLKKLALLRPSPRDLRRLVEPLTIFRGTIRSAPPPSASPSAAGRDRAMVNARASSK